jgi:hypothetical protein
MARTPRTSAPESKATPDNATTPERSFDPVAGELARLVQGEHRDPHHILGLHKVDD